MSKITTTELDQIEARLRELVDQRQKDGYHAIDLLIQSLSGQKGNEIETQKGNEIETVDERMLQA